MIPSHQGSSLLLALGPLAVACQAWMLQPRSGRRIGQGHGQLALASSPAGCQFLDAELHQLLVGAGLGGEKGGGPVVAAAYRHQRSLQLSRGELGLILHLSVLTSTLHTKRGSLLSQVCMAFHPARQQAIQRCLEQGEAPAQVAAELGVAASTLRGWLRLARLEQELAAVRQERDAIQLRQAQLVTELQQAAAALAELKGLLDRADPGERRAAG